MLELEEQRISCPYCGEAITVLLDPSQEDQQYTEDCQVCCRPIDFELHYDNGRFAQVSVRREDD